MVGGPPEVVIVSSAHWSGDPRLGRHLAYLRSGGRRADLITFEPKGRPGRLAAMVRSLVAALRSGARVVILPDPELHLAGALLRLFGRRVVIDVHEDYPKSAASRPWIPSPLRPLVAAVAWLNDRLGRRLASATVVAAPELAHGNEILVANVPDPETFRPRRPQPGPRLVYVGDVTEARGVFEMLAVLAALGSGTLDLIGRVDSALAGRVLERASSLGIEERVNLHGRLDHTDAWRLAGGAICGLSLLGDIPAYRHAVATKLWEYMAAGIPPIVSDLPGQAGLVARIDPMLVVDNPEEAAAAVIRLLDPETHSRVVEAGLALVAESWSRLRPDLAIRSAVFPGR